MKWTNSVGTQPWAWLTTCRRLVAHSSLAASQNQKTGSSLLVSVVDVNTCSRLAKSQTKKQKNKKKQASKQTNKQPNKQTNEQKKKNIQTQKKMRPKTSPRLNHLCILFHLTQPRWYLATSTKCLGVPKGHIAHTLLGDGPWPVGPFEIRSFGLGGLGSDFFGFFCWFWKQIRLLLQIFGVYKFGENYQKNDGWWKRRNLHAFFEDCSIQWSDSLWGWNNSLQPTARSTQQELFTKKVELHRG